MLPTQAADDAALHQFCKHYISAAAHAPAWHPSKGRDLALLCACQLPAQYSCFHTGKHMSYINSVIKHHGMREPAARARMFIASGYIRHQSIPVDSANAHARKLYQWGPGAGGDGTDEWSFPTADREESSAMLRHIHSFVLREHVLVVATTPMLSGGKLRQQLICCHMHRTTLFLRNLYCYQYSCIYYSYYTSCSVLELAIGPLFVPSSGLFISLSPYCIIPIQTDILKVIMPSLYNNIHYNHCACFKTSLESIK